MSYVVSLQELGDAQVGVVGGKAASLGELARVVPVPKGFCVTTAAFREGLTAGVVEAIEREVGEGAYAVRSSATAEDLPTASFAGQHESYLNVVGPAAVVEHVRRCWASLDTERAVAYRDRQGFADTRVEMAVVVQEMVPAQAAGVMFTADPVSGNRRVVCVEAVAGLGEELVSGRVTPSVYRVTDGVTGQGVLSEAEVLRLAELGRQIEAHFGSPQDIEWCLADGEFWFVQSRPITTLFPIPPADDDAFHVYLSVGHQQMMTDAMKPLGLSVWQLTALRPMVHAGGRLFVDITQQLGTAAGRAGLMGMAGKSDPLVRDALESVVALLPPVPEAPAPPPREAPEEPWPDVADLVARSEASVAALQRDIQGKSGPELFEFILADLQELKRLLSEPASHRAIMLGMEAAWWLSERVEGADTLTQSVPGNVTSEMGLALLDVADALRADPQDRTALQGFLHKYGMRCAGEIDITRTRWAEDPSALEPLLQGNLQNFAPGEAARRFERGLQEAAAKEREVLSGLPADEAAQMKRMIDQVRHFAGYREYPKFSLVSRYFIYKQALLREAERLGLGEDIFYLTFPELQSGGWDAGLIQARKAEFRAFQGLRPPRVLTSDGEGFNGVWRREGAPEGALLGQAVSAGTVEGRARVIRSIAQADFEPGDILVTAYTDPSWTPAFVQIRALVTEVGGMMSHGAVIAREYGLPAIVGVDRATERIQDGQLIRVHGTEGYVEVLGTRRQTT